MGNRPGESLKKLRTKSLKLSFKNWFISIIFLSLGIYLSFQKLPFLKFLGIVSYIFTFSYFYITNSYIKKVDRIDFGYKGEINVAKILDELPKDFKVIHDINVDDKFNIDHLVIGPTGIFTIETKNHIGRITNSGDTLLINNKLFEKDIIKQAISESYYIKEKIKNSLNLNVYVKPVIVFANPKTYVESDEVKGVKTISIRMLKKYLITQTIKFNILEIQKIYDLFTH